MQPPLINKQSFNFSPQFFLIWTLLAWDELLVYTVLTWQHVTIYHTHGKNPGMINAILIWGSLHHKSCNIAMRMAYHYCQEGIWSKKAELLVRSITWSWSLWACVCCSILGHKIFSQNPSFSFSAFFLVIQAFYRECLKYALGSKNVNAHSSELSSPFMDQH